MTDCSCACVFVFVNVCLYAKVGSQGESEISLLHSDRKIFTQICKHAINARTSFWIEMKQATSRVNPATPATEALQLQTLKIGAICNAIDPRLKERCKSLAIVYQDKMMEHLDKGYCKTPSQALAVVYMGEFSPLEPTVALEDPLNTITKGFLLLPR